MLVQTRSRLSMLKDILDTTEMETERKIAIITTGENKERGKTMEFYGKSVSQLWNNLLTAYQTNRWDNNAYLRVDLVTEEEKITFELLQQQLKKIKRNNYIDFNLRFDGIRKRSFLKEELVGNAVIKPDNKHIVGKNHPNLHIDPQNYRGYVKRKYNREESDLSYLERSNVYLFKTKAYYIENDQIIPLEDYGNGNRVRTITEETLNEMTDLVIAKGSEYLKKQLMDTGQFIYGYYPCYDQPIKGYNSVRHFSSLYALVEAAEYFSDEEMLLEAKAGLIWGIKQLTINEQGYFFIKDFLGKEVEYKLGAQATAILAIAKYIQVSKDDSFETYLKQLVRTISQKFITKDNQTIHVLDKALAIKERFRIIYYDGEALFSLLRAYEILNEQAIFETCEILMEHFVTENYQKYHDHWLSYATNEMLKHKEKITYYRFGIKNALVNIDFIEQRDTAYPTMLELLVAASKMMKKLEKSELKNELFKTPTDFLEVKERIDTVMKKRVSHEIKTGVMFPEFAVFFKKPATIDYGFFARHDRFRMRIDDAEHFLSGLINYRSHYKD
ncbi:MULTISPECIES: hypothetical protein [unclassified Enterococcus]|uniref:hypothetical protein n=1 Tax=unclassified Enterococcus TaxID=2608891 RepID=UPI001A9B95B4|nr:hypothetical protein [Enterococcus sp. DIV1271a]